LSRPSVCAPTPATRTRGPPIHRRSGIVNGGTRFVASARLYTYFGHAEAWPSSAPTFTYCLWRDALCRVRPLVYLLRSRGSVVLQFTDDQVSSMEGRALSRPPDCIPTSATRKRGPPMHRRLRIAYGGTCFCASVRLCTDSGHPEAWASSASTFTYYLWRDALCRVRPIVYLLRPRGRVGLQRIHVYVLPMEGRALSRPSVCAPTPATRKRGPPVHRRSGIVNGETPMTSPSWLRQASASMRPPVLCTNHGHAEAWPSNAPTFTYRLWRDAPCRVRP